MVWPCQRNSEQENKIQNVKLKLLPANYKHSRQKQKQSTVFVFAVNVCSLPEVISICCSEFYFLVLNFILP